MRNKKNKIFAFSVQKKKNTTAFVLAYWKLEKSDLEQEKIQQMVVRKFEFQELVNQLSPLNPTNLQSSFQMLENSQLSRCENQNSKSTSNSRK